eukprot:TRINITY_DN24390_c0_g1_i1.p1 TRINITY_DN24390_c0_g1~~TRINITY_DN24390_c0_g1_i1.p1  ORF type:complete len:357 (+),score=43.43 TRINITY_DN24390_c0_g1_i1:36-1073(+)
MPRPPSKPSGKVTKTCPVFGCSLIGAKGKELLRSIGKKLGYKIANSRNLEGCTHLITGEERGLKQMYAKGRGIPIVNLAWLADCGEKGEWSEVQTSEQRKMFQKISFTINGTDTTVGEQNLKELVELHGGTVSKEEKSPAFFTLDKNSEKSFLHSIYTGDSLQAQGGDNDSSSNKQPNEEPKTPAPLPKFNSQSASQGSSDLLTKSTSPPPPVLLLLCKQAAPAVPPRIVLSKEKLTVGRSSKRAAADVIIDSVLIKNMISRKHATFSTIPTASTASPWEVTLCDEESTNGFFVNGIKRKQWVLSDKDIITFGGGGEIEPGWKADEINSDCVYQFHAKGQEIWSG